MPSLVLFIFATCLPTVWLMALDDFVNFPDSHYSYTLLNSELVRFSTKVDTIKMTSQKWLNESEVDKPVWRHTLTIVVPKKQTLRHTCLLILRPGKRDESSSSELSYNLIKYVGSPLLNAVIAFMSPLPNLPLTFFDHPLGRKKIRGYDILAYSWWKFLNDPTAPPHWLVQFPMVKATVRAIDTIVAHIKKDYQRDITNFTLAGVSTAGWITWLTAAVDKRVEGIMPLGMDFLNFTESFHHQYRAYCGWSFKLRPFYVMNITQELDNPRFSEIASHVDPLAYNERYKYVYKFIIIFSGDELFPPDNSRYYFSQLEGVKYLQIIPNADYGFTSEDLFVSSIVTFYIKMIFKRHLHPTVSWEIKTTNTSGTITLRAYNVNQVFSYYADTVDGTRRDFRMRIAADNSSKNNSVKWIESQFFGVITDTYMVEMQKPEKGWRAFFIQVRYPWDIIDAHFTVTSEMVILPETFPCSDCSGEECYGTLV